MLRGAGPWGQAFPEPIFDGEFLIVDARIVGDKHLKMRLMVDDRPNGDRRGGPSGHGGGPRGGTETDPIEAIFFGYIGDAAEDPLLSGGARIQLAYRLEINDYRGSERVQLNCRHLRLT
jgi:single-stranded-DNA-specific exonuclease